MVLEPKQTTVAYRCTKCGEIKRNKSADDDDFDEILRVAKDNANYGNF